MTSMDPLKSALSIMAVDDTSLALPSANHLRSGEQRVLEQVQTIRRHKSRHCSSKSASASLSPTSPVYDPVFIDSSKSSTSNGSAFFGNGLSKTLSYDKNISRYMTSHTKGAAMKKSGTVSTYQLNGYGPVGSMARGQFSSSRSEPGVAWQRTITKSSVPSQRHPSSRGTYRKEASTGQFITRTRSQLPVQTLTGTGQAKTKSQFVCSPVDVSKTMSQPPILEYMRKRKESAESKGNPKVANLTMKEAVEYLSSKDEMYQHWGASYIQHNTFIDDKAKEDVSKLNGIPALVALLRSPSVHVHQTASAALRNLSFKNNKNKEEIDRCGGIAEAVALLRDTNSAETQKQLTGLLWNLSSVDSLKPELLKCALPVLMESVILPYTTGLDRSENDAEAFCNTTGCLRNLSSTKQSNRQAMRKCRGLIDSLVRYVKESVDAGKPDNRSVENCVCILNNLTFQLESEAPALFTRITALAKPSGRSQSQGDAGPIGCFSPQSRSVVQERNFDYPVVEDPNPSGAGWLIHSKTLQTYLSLLDSSQQEETQEASCGVLQNLTANEGIVSDVMSQIIVQKLNGLQVISPFLKSNKANLQRSAVALVGNMSRNPNLQNAMARKALPELMSVLNAGTKEGNESDDTLAMACQAANAMIMREPEMSKHLLNNNLIRSLSDLSQNLYFPKSKKAAAVLLYNLWSDKDLQGFLKKQGMSKSSFVNDITMAAHKAIQIVD